MMDDLFSLAQAPNMGGDFQSIAGMMKPQMMPIGPSVHHAMRYAKDDREFKAMLQKAVQLAELNAMLKGQQAEEYAAGAPGRMTRIHSATKEAEFNEGQLPDKFELSRRDMGNKLEGTKLKAMQQAMQELEPYINSWDKADDEQKTILHKMMRDEGLSFGKIKLGDLPLATADKLMKALRQAQANTPKLEFQREQEEGKNYRKEIELNSKEDVEEAKRELALRLKRMSISASSATSQANVTPDKVLGRIMDKDSKGEPLTASEKRVAQLAISIRNYDDLVKAAGLKPETTFSGGKIETKPKPVPAQPDINAGRDTKEDTPPVKYLTEGKPTKFKNGQIWTLENGKPKRIK